MKVKKNPHELRELIVSALEKAGDQGMTLGELQHAIPGAGRSTLCNSLVRIRDAAQAFTIHVHPVALHFHCSIAVEAAEAAFQRRAKQIRAEVLQAITLGLRSNDGKPAGRPRGTRDTKPRKPRCSPARQRLDQLQANRTARAIQGDGTHGAAQTAIPARITWPAHVEVTVCPGWRGRFEGMKPAQGGLKDQGIGNYESPPSRWAEAALSGER